MRNALRIPSLGYSHTLAWAFHAQRKVKQRQINPGSLVARPASSGRHSLRSRKGLLDRIAPGAYEVAKGQAPVRARSAESCPNPLGRPHFRQIVPDSKNPAIPHWERPPRVRALALRVGSIIVGLARTRAVRERARASRPSTRDATSIRNGPLTNCSRVVRHGVAPFGTAADSSTYRNSFPCHELARTGTELTRCTFLLEANGVAEVGSSNLLAPTISPPRSGR